MQEKYAHSLEWCLQHRALPLIAAVVLLVFSGWQVLNMGVELLPSITSNEAQITLSTADGLTKEESYAIAGQVAEAALNVETWKRWASPSTPAWPVWISASWACPPPLPIS